MNKTIINQYAGRYFKGDKDTNINDFIKVCVPLIKIASRVFKKVSDRDELYSVLLVECWRLIVKYPDVATKEGLFTTWLNHCLRQKALNWIVAHPLVKDHIPDMITTSKAPLVSSIVEDKSLLDKVYAVIEDHPLLKSIFLELQKDPDIFLGVLAKRLNHAPNTIRKYWIVLRNLTKDIDNSGTHLTIEEYAENYERKPENVRVVMKDARIPTTKKCSKCKKTKKSDLFYKERRSKDGLQNYCKKCTMNYIYKNIRKIGKWKLKCLTK